MKWFFWGVFAGSSFTFIGGMHIPITDLAWSLIGVTPTHGPDFFCFSIVFWPFWLGGILCAWFPFRARVHEKDLQRLYEVYNNLHKDSGLDASWWETYKNETLIPLLTQQELAGTLRFPTWKERTGPLRFSTWKMNTMDEREFAFRNFVAYQVLKDPERRKNQTLLIDSIKRI